MIEFACVIDTDGTPGVGDVDYTSLGAWYAAMRNAANAGSLLFSHAGGKSPIVVPGTLAGTIPDNSAVTQVGTAATGRLVHVNRLGQALIARGTGFTGTPDDAGAWRLDASNTWTPTGPRAAASLRALCRGTTSDSSAIDWGEGKLVATSMSQPIVIEGDADPAHLVWDVTRFRWEVDTLAGVANFTNAVPNNMLTLRNLQLRNTSTATGSWTDATAVVSADGAFLWLEDCILRGGKHGLRITSSGGPGRASLQNILIYGYTDSGVYNPTAGSGGQVATVVQNGTLIGGLYGLRSNGTSSTAPAFLVENTYAKGTTAAYAVPKATLTRAASSDATGSAGLTGIAADLATFAAPAAADYRPAASSPLRDAGVDLAPGRARRFADLSGTQDSGQGAPVGILAFEAGSSTAVLRVWNSMTGAWFDGVSYSPNDRPLDLSQAIPLRHPSTTADWIILCTDSHGLRHNKTTVFPNIDRLRAGTLGTWTAATSLGWVQGTTPCAGRLAHMLFLGDNQPTDTDQYGDTLNHWRDTMWNTSGEAGAALGMDRAYWENRTWMIGGNHDRYASAFPTTGLETWRFNQHGRATDDAGAAYADAAEQRVAPLVGNHRFLMLGWQHDDAWARQVVAAVAANGENLFVLPHAPMPGTTRQSYYNMFSSALDAALAASDFVAAICGHTHNYDPGQGLDAACVGNRRDYPDRPTRDIGAARPVPPAPVRRPVRWLRAGGRAVRGI